MEQTPASQAIDGAQISLSLVENNLGMKVIQPIQKLNSSGYCSETFKITAKDRNKSKFNLIAKVPYNTDIYKGAQDKFIFHNEIFMYESVLPKIEQYLGHREGDEDSIAAKLWTTDGDCLIILDDLYAKDYRMILLDETMDVNYARAVLQKLAQFHAASLKLDQDEPDVLNRTKSGSFIINHLKDATLAPKYIKRFSTAIGAMFSSNLNAEWQSMVNKIESNYTQSIVQDLDPKDSKFNVLNHMDMWLSNIFVRNTAPDVIDVKLVDFQLCKWTNPAIDIWYFFISCCSYDTFEQFGDSLLESYIKTLQATLDRMNYCDCDYSLDALKNDMDRRLNFALLMTTFFLPVTRAIDRKASLDLDNQSLLYVSRYQKIAKSWLSYLIKRICNKV